MYKIGVSIIISHAFYIYISTIGYLNILSGNLIPALIREQRLRCDTNIDLQCILLNINIYIYIYILYMYYNIPIDKQYDRRRLKCTTR